MLKVALTGGIATGKSYVRARLAAAGVPAIDADALVHEALGPGTAVAAGVVRLFGPGVLAPNGAIDRRKLGAIVFADDASRQSLEQLVHPAVYEAIAAWFAGLSGSPGHAWALADVPLLFETGRSSWFDKVIVAACTPEEQVRRVMVRDGLSEGEASLRMAAQWPIGGKVQRADYVVWTDRGFDETNRQVDEVYRRVSGIASRTP